MNAAVETEYILVKEALACTGLSEKTLRARLRGRVPQIGNNAWFRNDFFNFWRAEAERKRERLTSAAVERAGMFGKNIASPPRSRTITPAEA